MFQFQFIFNLNPLSSPAFRRLLSALFALLMHMQELYANSRFRWRIKAFLECARDSRWQWTRSQHAVLRACEMESARGGERIFVARSLGGSLAAWESKCIFAPRTAQSDLTIYIFYFIYICSCTSREMHFFAAAPSARSHAANKKKAKNWICMRRAARSAYIEKKPAVCFFTPFAPVPNASDAKTSQKHRWKERERIKGRCNFLCWYAPSHHILLICD